MPSIHRFFTAFPRRRSCLTFALVLALGDAPAGHAQPLPAPAASRADGSTPPATQQVQLDLIVMQMQHDHYLRLMEFVGNAPPTKQSQSQPIVGICKSTHKLLIFLEALREAGLVKLMAEPRLVTLSGRPLCFQLGGMSAPTVAEGAAVPTEASGTQISLLPTVLPEGKISLELMREVREIIPPPPGSPPTANPGRNIDSVTTTVVLKSGQTFVVGGLGNRMVSVKKTVTSVPILGELPLVGCLFRSEEYSQNEIDTVVLVTPRHFPPPARTRPSGDAERLRQLELRLKKAQQEIENIRKDKPEGASGRNPS
jgi:Flp pilus assembly secretin CpaC